MRSKALKRQKKAIQEKLTSLSQKEAEIYRSAFEREKDLTDRALKLAETSKGKSNWQLTGLAAC